jgi:hypothetical protein
LGPFPPPPALKGRGSNSYFVPCPQQPGDGVGAGEQTGKVVVGPVLAGGGEDRGQDIVASTLGTQLNA